MVIVAYINENKINEDFRQINVSPNFHTHIAAMPQLLSLALSDAKQN
jgi:hypothetical protein